MSSNEHREDCTELESNLSTIQEKAEKNVYCISGLGADRRVFNKLKLQGYQPVHLDWLSPQKRENLTDYAKRLAAKISEEQPILIGLSFGGIVAIEIAKHISVRQIILISSVKTRAEIPFYFRLFRTLPLHRLIPFKSLLWIAYRLLDWFFSLETLEERKLLKAILKDTDAQFLKWAIDRLIFWQNETIADNICHLHGRCDRIFPLAYVKPNIIIEKGGHFMIFNRANEISQLLISVWRDQNQQS
jgi:pimeloyl-ACP methyl ester carboxylesterase